MRIFPLKFFKVKGRSMEPSLFEGDYVLLRLTKNVKTGEIVVFERNGHEIIKRVSRIQDESLWVLGDNPKYSTDSRAYGWIERERVVGKVIWMIK